MGLGDVVSGVLGGSAGKDEMKQSLALSKEARDALKRLYIPTVAEQEILLQYPELAGLLEAQQLGPSAMEEVSTDPRLKNAQMKALEQLAGLSETGLGAEDVAAMNQLKRSAGAEGQSQIAGILQREAEMGRGSATGNALIAQLNAVQNQTNRMQQGAEAQAAQAAAARRQALGQYADMSSQLANTDWSQRAQVGSARDAISRFNSQNRQDVQQYNLGQQQAINNAKTATANQQQMHNKGLIQQKFQNELAKTTGVANQTNNLANTYAGMGQAAAQGQANMMSGILGAAGSMGSAYIAKK